jgi:hypothetical protein
LGITALKTKDGIGGNIKNGFEEVGVEDVNWTELTHLRSNGRLWY